MFGNIYTGTFVIGLTGNKMKYHILICQDKKKINFMSKLWIKISIIRQMILKFLQAYFIQLQ